MAVSSVMFMEADIYLVMFLTALCPLLNAKSMLPALFRVPINVLVSALLSQIWSVSNSFHIYPYLYIVKTFLQRDDKGSLSHRKGLLDEAWRVL